jgi:hypothetical protein
VCVAFQATQGTPVHQPDHVVALYGEQGEHMTGRSGGRGWRDQAGAASAVGLTPSFIPQGTPERPGR